MALEEIRDIELLGDGVVFQYLVFSLQLEGAAKRIARGSNYISSGVDSEEALIRWTRQDLEDAGFLRREESSRSRAEGPWPAIPTTALSLCLAPMGRMARIRTGNPWPRLSRQNSPTTRSPGSVRTLRLLPSPGPR